jgi:hypothetical protein
VSPKVGFVVSVIVDFDGFSAFHLLFSDVCVH